MNRHSPRILIISQVYVPDPTSVGQHMADAAEELARRGYDVRVLTSARCYDNPSVKYPRRERLGGVEVIRLPLSSFGKRTILLRLLGQFLFLTQAIVRGILTGRLAKVLVSTSPPMCSIAALAIRAVRRVPIKFWVMDINPDQTIALGKIPAEGWAARAFEWLNRRILKAAEDVIVLDRFMADRINSKLDVASKLTILPPWPHEDELALVAREENPFIREHGLEDKFVVMYSGNHGLSTPLETLVEAALRLQDHPKLCFLFIGGGLGKRCVHDAIADYDPTNIVSLPYQPLSEIKYSLSAADVHVASLVDPMVGVLHPCKIYGAMAVGKPILWFGPSPSHATDIIEKHHLGWRIAHGDVTAATELLEELAEMDPGELAQMGRRARRVLRESYSKHRLCGAFCNVVERDRSYGYVITPAAGPQAGASVPSGSEPHAGAASGRFGVSAGSEHGERGARQPAAVPEPVAAGEREQVLTGRQAPLWAATGSGRATADPSAEPRSDKRSPK